MTAAERLLAEALALPEDERIALAERLVQSTREKSSTDQLDLLRRAAQMGFSELDAGLGVELSSTQLVARLKAGKPLLGE
jgi:hypothetical protein